MDAFLRALQAHDVNQLSIIVGQPDIFLGIIVTLGIALIAGFFLPVHAILKAVIWIVFLGCDAVVLYLAFMASPMLTDYDYGPMIDTPPAAVALTERPKSSDRVCVPVATLDPLRLKPTIERSCSAGDPASQTYVLYGLTGDQLCYNVTTEPLAGHQCAVSVHFHAVTRHRRDGLLQIIHEKLGRTGPDARDELPIMP